MGVHLKVAYLPDYKSDWPRLSYKYNDDSGFDLRAAIPEPITLHPGEFKLIPCGVCFEFIKDANDPFLYEMQIRARSGLAAKKGIGVVNAPGTVDFGYRGEVKTPLINFSNEDFIIEPGERIVQAVICPIVQATFEQVDEVTESARGAGGFGSTGTK